MAALALAVGVGLYGGYLVVVGQEWTVVQEAVPLGDPHGARIIRRLPAPQGLIPLIGGGVAAIGLIARRPLLAWFGTTIVALFAILFLFGVGGVLVPFAAALVVLLATAGFNRATAAERR